MRSTVEVKISGLAELAEKLEKAPLKASRRIMRNALRPAGQIWLEAMRAKVRQGPHHFKGKGTLFGVLAKSLKLSASVTSSLVGSVAVGIGKAFWGFFVEYGTRIRRRGKSTGSYLAISAASGGQTRHVRRKGASAGQMPSFPFMRPVFESTKRQVEEKFVEGVRQGLRDEGLL
jgi:HK97 gp10 family phage protein